MADLKSLKPHVVTSSPQDKIWLFYGPPGTRKTTVATGNPNETLLLAYEIGYKFIPGIFALNLTNWHGLKDAVRQLADIDTREKYKTIAIDTIGLAYKACISYICNLKGVTEIGQIPYGQGYSLAKNEFEKVIGSIPQMGYGLIMIAHSDELNDEKIGVSVKVDIDKRPSSVIKGMADFILYARKEKRDESEDENDMTVYAYSEVSNPNIEVKSRARFFPKKFEFTYDKLISSLDVAITKQNEFFGVKSNEKPDFTVYQETEVDLTSIQNEIKALAESLSSMGLGEEIAKIINEHLKGVRVTQTTKTHTTSLYAIRDELTELKKRN
jgi:DNA polymerase III delta prime subunit